LSRGPINVPKDQIDVQKEDCTMNKRALDLEQLEAQTAFELPDREVLALINVFITDVLNHNTVTVVVKNIHIAATVCALVQVISVLTGAALDCSFATQA